MHFHTLRSGIQSNVAPAAAPVLLLRAQALRDGLEATRLFDSVEVEPTDDRDRLVVALCRFRPHLAEEQVARAVDELWESSVRFPFWEAHSTEVDDDHVEFQAATRQGPAGGYVTVHLVAQRSPVPSQRGPRD